MIIFEIPLPPFQFTYEIYHEQEDKLKAFTNFLIYIYYLQVALCIHRYCFE